METLYKDERRDECTCAGRRVKWQVAAQVVLPQRLGSMPHRPGRLAVGLGAGKEGDYLVDRLAEEAEKFIRAPADKPFFLVLSHYAVHTPLQGKPDKVARYEKVAKDRRQGKPAYAAMVESVDESVGRVMRTLRELKLDRRTLVIFTSDNGGYAGATDNSPLRANKGSNYQGGIRVPVIIKWPGRTKPGSVSSEPVISTDFYPTILAATGQDTRPNPQYEGK